MTKELLIIGCILLSHFLTADTFAQWELKDSGVSANLTDLCFVDPLHGWAIGGHSREINRKPTIIATVDGGETWHKQVCPVRDIILQEICSVDEHVGYIVGRSGVILSTRDGGTNWMLNKSGVDLDLMSVSFVNRDTGWVAGGDLFKGRRKGVILHTKDGGMTWEKQLETDADSNWKINSPSQAFRAIDFYDQNHGWAITGAYAKKAARTEIYRTTDGGKNWEIISGITGRVSQVKAVSPDTIWAGLTKSTDGGREWYYAGMGKGFGLVNHIPSVSGVVDWFASGVLLLTQYGRVARPSIPYNPKGIRAVELVGKNIVWAAGVSGVLKKYTGKHTQAKKQIPPNNINTDGPKIVFLSSRDSYNPRSDGLEEIDEIYQTYFEKCEIYLMDIDGKNQIGLTDNDFLTFLPKFSPDGSKIIFQSSEDMMIPDIYIMDIDGKNLVALTDPAPTGRDGGGFPIFSRDGSTILYQGERNIYRMSPDGTDKHILTQWEDKRISQDLPLEFSYDGSTILFISSLGGGSNNDIYTMATDGSNIKQLTQSKSYDGGLCSFSPDGSKILFISYRSGKAQVYIMDNDGSKQIQLTNTKNNDHPEFSPDGSKIIFRSNRDGNSEIYIMNHDGSDQKRLTYTASYEQKPHFSPDGKKIVFESSTFSKGNYDIYIMNADGSDLKRLTKDAGRNHSPQFRPTY